MRSGSPPVSGEPGRRVRPGEVGTPFPASDPKPQFPDPARKSARHMREESVSALSSRPTVSRRTGEAQTTQGLLSLLRPLSFCFPLSTSLTRSLLPCLTHVAPFNRAPLPEPLPPTPLPPPHCLAGLHCPMPVPLPPVPPSSSHTILISSSPVPHPSHSRPSLFSFLSHSSSFSSLGSVPRLSRDQDAQRESRLKIPHSSALFRRTQASESPTTLS